MRAVLIILIAAVTLGLAGGYAWSVVTAPSVKAPKMKATTIAIPASPEERPEASDEEWAARADPEPVPAAAGSAAVASTVHYSGCNEVRALGKAPLHAGEPGYREDMDGDGDGIACEPIRR